MGEMEERVRLGARAAAQGQGGVHQGRLFDPVKPEWVEVDAARMRLERVRDFGGPWLGLELCRRVGLVEFFQEAIPRGNEEVEWGVMGLVLALCRWSHPSSELKIAEHFYEQSALRELLGVPAEKVNEDRLYRALDRLLPQKGELERRLRGRLGELFELGYDLLLYDVTSTYFEGEAKGNAQAQRGYSRDHRPDCKQVVIGLVVTRCGMPVGYEVFAGNRSDVTTLEEVVEKIEGRYGRMGRVWVLDRGLVSEEKVEYLKRTGRQYVVATPRGLLRRYERELVEEGWEAVYEDVEVKRCESPEGEEVFILCRSASRRQKEKAIHERFERRIEEGLRQIERGCQRRRQEAVKVAQRVGRLLGSNSRAAGLFEVKVQEGPPGQARLIWSKVEGWRTWASLSEGCYLLRTNLTDWKAADLWKTYIQLTEAEAAFRIQKSDLSIRPIWHQKGERVQAHILVCFLAYVLWKMLSQLCRRAGLGDEPRKVLAEIQQIKVADVVLPTKSGWEIRKRCVTRPTDHQAILLQRLGLHLPSRLEMAEM